MNKTFTVLAYISLLLTLSFSFTDSNRNSIIFYKPARISETDCIQIQKESKRNLRIQQPLLLTSPPPDTVTALSTFIDYATNGKTMKQLIVSHDTIIAVSTVVDSLGATDPNNSNSLKIVYNYSIDHGVTWIEPHGLAVPGDRKSRFPDLCFLPDQSFEPIFISGRIWNLPISSTLRRPGVAADLFFGAGAFDLNYFSGTLGYDLFSTLRLDEKLACIVGTPTSTIAATDTLYYTTYNLGAFSPKKIINTITLNNTSCSYTIAASPTDINNITVAYCYINEPGNNGVFFPTVRIQTSTDGGNTWPAPGRLIPDGVLNGDSCSCYWNEDITYKPGTNFPYVVFNTWDNTSGASADISRKSYKICIWSPNLNGGNPVVIADWHNSPIISSVTNFLRVRHMQVNSQILSHPSISFKDDGSMIAVAYSTAQVDSSVQGFNFEDLMIQYSSDGGLNWTTPVNITNTPNQVEMYPCFPKTYSGAGPDILYQWDLIPGSQSFTDGQPVNKVYWLFKRPPYITGIENSGNEIPKNFGLSQNYPNPFNPSSKIKFQIAVQSFVTLKVYDVLGKEIATLFNKDLKPGIYDVEWNASDYPSGVYFYKLTAGDFSETKKMILLK